MYNIDIYIYIDHDIFLTRENVLINMQSKDTDTRLTFCTSVIVISCVGWEWKLLCMITIKFYKYTRLIIYF